MDIIVIYCTVPDKKIAKEIKAMVTGTIQIVT